MSTSDAPITNNNNTTSSCVQNGGTANIDLSPNCVVSDVIELYCHRLILSSEDRTKNTHRLHYFLNIFGGKDIATSPRILCSVQLVGVLVKISHVHVTGDLDETRFDHRNDTTIDGDDGNEIEIDKSQGSNVNVVSPLSDYDSGQWEELLKELVNLRHRFIEVESDHVAISRDHFGTQTTSKRGKRTKPSSIGGMNDRGSSGRGDYSTMNIFTTLFDDIMNLGYFLQALSFVLPLLDDDIDDDDDRFFFNDPGQNLEFLTIFDQHIPDRCEYRDILESINKQKKGEIRKIINERDDLSLERFQLKAEKLLQNWYVTTVPIPYLVRLKYGVAVPHGLGRLEGSNDDNSHDEEPMSQPLLLENSGDGDRSSAQEVPLKKRRVSARGVVHHNREAEGTPLHGHHLEETIEVRTRPAKPITTTSRSESNKAQSDGKRRHMKRGERCTTKKGESLSFESGSDDSSGERPHLSEIPIRVATKPTRKEITISSQRKYGRKVFSQEEKHAIIAGTEKFGKGNWRNIKDYYECILANRTTVQIKDCYRTMLRKNEL